jgi:hypothetical protein
MKNSIRFYGIVFILLFAGNFMLPAQNGMGRGMNFPPRIPDLTDSQRKELFTLSQKHREKMFDLREEMRKTTDIETRGEIAKKMQIERDMHRKDVLGKLTDKQKEALKEYRDLPGMRGGRGPAGGNFRGRGAMGAYGPGDGYMRMRPGGVEF